VAVDSPCLPAEVKRHLTARLFGRRMYYMPDVDSTNRLAKELAKDGEREGTVVVTEFQTAGKGRRSRDWQSPPRKDLLFSLILKPERNTMDILPLTLAFSLGIANVLHDTLDVDVGVKWPNDVVTKSGKICGILSEGSSQGGKSAWVVVGIGINVNMAPADLHGDISAASCLSLTGEEQDRARLLAAVLAALDGTYGEFLTGGFARFLDEYRSALSRLGSRIHFQRNGVDRTGDIEEVQPDGGLVVRTLDAGLIVLYDEEITE